MATRPLIGGEAKLAALAAGERGKPVAALQPGGDVLDMRENLLHVARGAP
jgi:hypothetical protein